MSTSFPDAPAPVEPPVPRGFAAALLGAHDAWPALARRAAIGAALSSVYGVALGARSGAIAMLQHAVGVPAALLAVAALGVPALYIVMALFNAPLSAQSTLSAAARGIAGAGLVLAGLAPLAAIYVVGSETGDAAAISGAVGLAIGGALGLRQLVSAMREALREADRVTRLMATIVQLAFGAFAIVCAARVWSALLPVLGGGS